MSSNTSGEPVHKEHYDVLGVSLDATQDEIKKAYQRMVKKAHPDRGGSAFYFSKVNTANDVLSDHGKRKGYDQQSCKRRKAVHIFKGVSVQHNIDVTLEDLCKSHTILLPITRQRVEYPDGMTREDSVTECPLCDGKRFVKEIVCPGCKGIGKRVNPKVILKKEQIILKVGVEPGMHHGEKYVFRNEGNENPGEYPSDIIVFLNQKKHDLFQRRDDDLLLNKRITLRDCLCGFAFSIPLLDGRTVVFQLPVGEVIPPNTAKVIPNEGMPKFKDPNQKGNLIVYFDVIFPTRLPQAAIELVSRGLPKNIGSVKEQSYTGSYDNAMIITSLNEVLID
jgi:DnaJ-class molecular chaperone